MLTQSELTQAIRGEIDKADRNIELSFIQDYLAYAAKISNPKRAAHLRAVRAKFRGWAPFEVYITIGEAKKASGNVAFDLRYLGQSVGTILVGDTGEVTLEITPVKAAKNLRDFSDGSPESKILAASLTAPWDSSSASEFRSYFRKMHPRRSGASAGNEEHRVESALIAAFAGGSNKPVRYIRPVMLPGLNCRFPMTTGITASDHGNPRPGRGGIDILARTGNGRGTFLTVIEVKDQNTSLEAPEAALRQAAAYAVFLRRLLRSGEAGAGYWWRLFGFRREIPDRLVIRIASALPRQCTSGVSDNLDGLCGRGVTVPFDPQEPEGDCVELHTIFFDDVDPGDGHPNQLRNFTSTFHDWPEKPD